MTMAKKGLQTVSERFLCHTRLKTCWSSLSLTWARLTRLSRHLPQSGSRGWMSMGVSSRLYPHIRAGAQLDPQTPLVTFAWHRWMGQNRLEVCEEWPWFAGSVRAWMFGIFGLSGRHPRDSGALQGMYAVRKEAGHQEIASVRWGGDPLTRLEGGPISFLWVARSAMRMLDLLPPPSLSPMATTSAAMVS